MTSKRLAAALAGGLFSVAALAGCGSDSGGGELAGSWDGIVEAAKKEGEVVIYGTVAPPDNLELLKKAFEKKYPDIELTYVRGTDADLLPKVEIENQTGRGTADVHMTTDAGWIDRSADGGYSVDIVGPSFDNEDYDRSNSVIDDQWFLTSATVFGLGWNTQKLPNGVTSPEDLLAANLKGGKLGVTNRPASRRTSTCTAPSTRTSVRTTSTASPRWTRASTTAPSPSARRSPRVRSGHRRRSAARS